MPTAVPAFIGYTPQAAYEGKSYINVAFKISSYAEFKTVYGYPDPPTPADPVQQYNPQYYFLAQESQPLKGAFMLAGNTYYTIVPDAGTVYYFYNCIRSFYENGGSDAYIVSIGTYGPPSGHPMNPEDRIVNPNIRLDEILGGLALLKNEPEPTLYLCPEATLLTPEENGKLMQAMLSQCHDMGTAVCIFDVPGGGDPDPATFADDISTFRHHTGSIGLSCGTAYYPYIGTTIMHPTELDYTNLFGGDAEQLLPLINPAEAPNETAASILSSILKPSGKPLTRAQYQHALMDVSPLYGQMMRKILDLCNLIPPSGAMAGLITRNDREQAVWKSLANISIVGAETLPVRLSPAQLEDLNRGDISAKPINAILSVNDRGFLPWGAKTLDGNSDDFKYLPAKRTVIFISQSCRLALNSYSFEPNDKNTWSTVTSLLNDFLRKVWSEGGLTGASPADAFSVNCGLGTSMTSNDILAGLMLVNIQVAIVRPAEFIVLNFRQKMDTSDLK